MGYLYAICAAVAWGLVYALREKTAPFVTPLGAMFLYGITLTAVSGPLLLSGKGSFGNIAVGGWASVGLSLLASAVSVVGVWLILISIDRLGAGLSSVIEISYPLFVVLFYWLLLGQSVNWAVAAGGALIFTGSCIVMYYGKG